jgi:hypothetical protein
MRLTRQRGNVSRIHGVEQAHQDLTGQFRPYWEIAADLYDRHPTQGQVRDEILRRYGVTISEKTASLWINRGQEERRRAVPA